MIELLTVGVDWTLQAAQHGGNGTGMTGFGGLWSLLVVGLIVAVVAGVLYSTVSQDREPRPDTTDTLALLRERYARGEIDHEEFESRRSRLEGADY